MEFAQGVEHGARRYLLFETLCPCTTAARVLVAVHATTAPEASEQLSACEAVSERPLDVEALRHDCRWHGEGGTKKT